MTTESAWVPQACTLPGEQRLLRSAEFGELFAAALGELSRPELTRLRLSLDPSAEQHTRDLLARESECCSFFTFTITVAAGELTVDIEVPATQLGVLDALAVRAATVRRPSA